MKTISRITGLILGSVALVFATRAGGDSGTTPDFNEVRLMLVEHLAGSSPAQLNQAAVKGLLAELKGRAILLSEAAGAATNGTTPITSEKVFDSDIAYLRIKCVGAGLDAAVASAARRLMASNNLAGMILDLRYANGEDYAGAAATTDLFLSDEVPLLNAGKGLISAKRKDDAIKLPVVALVNHDTTAAAEALAAMLRQTGVGLLLGNTTAGRAGVTTDYQLSTGQTLRVVTGLVQLGDAKPVSSDGVAPDVTVAVKPGDEALYYDDPFARLDGAGLAGLSPATTNADGGLSMRVRVTEADLVREKRGDGDLETLAGVRATTEERPAKVGDPVLARAIDLLKGLAVVRQWKF